MHPSKLRIFLNVNSVKCNLIRKISVTSPSLKMDKEMTRLKSWKEIPGPSSLPLIGQTHHFLPGGDFHKLEMTNIFDMMYDKYGPIAKLELMFTPPTIFLTDPDTIQKIFYAENNMPRRPGMFSFDYYRRYHKKINGQPPQYIGLGTDYGEPWKVLRSMANQILLQPNIISRYSNTIHNIAQDMILRLKSLRDEKNMIKDFETQIKLWSLESVTYIATGCRINCIDHTLKENLLATRLTERLDEMFSEKMMFMDFIMPIAWKYLPTRTYKYAMSMYEDMEHIAEHFIRMGMEELKKNGKVNDEEKSVLEKLLDKNKEVALILTCDIIMGSFHTLSTTIISILYLLAVNQDKQQKLRESFTSDETRTYLKACIKESMRVLSPTSSNARIINKDHNILGYKVPKDAIVIFYHEKLMLDAKQYPQPGEFIPERWTVGKEDPLYYGNAHPFASVPFGFGARACIGRRISELQLETALYHIVKNFSVEWQGPPPVVKRSNLNVLQGLCFVLNDVEK